MRLFDLYHNGKLHKIHLRIGYYEFSGNLSIKMIEWKDGSLAEIFGILTINLGIMCEEGCAYIDIDKNDKETILPWLEENDIAVPTGDVSDDGYPEYRFNPEVLQCVCVEILEEEIAR